MRVLPNVSVAAAVDRTHTYWALPTVFAAARVMFSPSATAWFTPIDANFRHYFRYSSCFGGRQQQHRQLQAGQKLEGEEIVTRQQKH